EGRGQEPRRHGLRARGCLADRKVHTYAVLHRADTSMRVRISFDALRLCLLVAAGVTSGYLWRAAFESSSPEVRVAGKGRIVEQAPAPPVVRIPPGRLTPRVTSVAGPHRAVRHNAVRHVQPGHAVLVSRPVAPAPKPTPAQPKPAPKPTPS